MVLGHRRHSTASNKSLGDQDAGNVSEEETIVDEQQGNVLSHIISQLRPGADLSRITLPTFILEPRSMLERITNFMAHPETLLPMPDIDDPKARFVSVVKFYLSGWHIKPPGVKKPLNPVLGETFYGYWDYPDGTRGYYISEQTSHHPPKSSYFFMAPEHNIRIDGTLKPRSKFLGNSAGSMMEGLGVMRFLNRNGERYFVTQPNMYARGILFGKMKYELGDHSVVKCPETGFHADIEFKNRGYFAGKDDSIGGFIKDANEHNLYELSGVWNGKMYLKDLSSGQTELLFDASAAKETPPKARPLEEQEPTESQKLWLKTVQALKKRDQDAATTEKSKIEDEQRELAAKRGGEESWKPKLFRPVQGGAGGSEEGEENLDWIIDLNIDGKSAEEKTQQILAFAPVLPKAEMGSQPTTTAPKPTPAGDAPAPAPAAKAQATPMASTAKQADAAAEGSPTTPTAPKAEGISRGRVERLDSTTDEVEEFIDAQS